MRGEHKSNQPEGSTCSTCVCVSPSALCVWRRYVNGCIAGPIKRQYADYEESLLSKLCSLLGTAEEREEHAGIFVTISKNSKSYINYIMH